MAVEDFVGRTLVLLWYLNAAMRHVFRMKDLVASRELDPTWLIECARSLSLLLFAVVVCFATIARRPVRGASEGLEPRISALLGTFMMPLVGLLPIVTVDANLILAGSLVTAVGMGVAAVCLLWLGRSFAIAPTARQLVTAGPYRYVRHPVYSAEIIAIAGMMVACPRWPTIVAGFATMALQYRRSVNEERVLRKAFPEYDSYARRVPRIVPRLAFWRS